MTQRILAHAAHDDQATLFDLTPPGAETPIANRIITPGSLLPLPANQVIDLARTMAILDLHPRAVLMLRNSGEISGYRHDDSKRWYIHYNSVMDFCDRLRIKFAIRDRRPKLAPGRRWRDADLLPFPLADTVTADDAMRGLDLDRTRVHELIEAGKFESYQIAPKMPWRISRTSLFRFAESLKEQLDAGRKPHR